METWNGVFQLESELKWEPAGEGVVRQIMGYDGQLMIVKVKFTKGSVGMMHKHYHSQATYVASGKFELTIGDEKKVLGAGAAITWLPTCCTAASAWRRAF